MTSTKQWQVEYYEILSVTQVTGMYAVYAGKSDSEERKYELFKHPIYFIGVAKVKIVTMEMFEKEKNSRVVHEELQGTRVVGLELSNGFFDICNEANNFAGLLMEGEPIENATGFLDPSEYPLILKD